MDKLAPNSTHSSRKLLKYFLGRGSFDDTSSGKGNILRASPPPPIVGLLKMRVKLKLPIVENLHSDKKCPPLTQICLKRSYRAKLVIKAAVNTV